MGRKAKAALRAAHFQRIKIDYLLVVFAVFVCAIVFVAKSIIDSDFMRLIASNSFFQAAKFSNVDRSVLKGIAIYHPTENKEFRYRLFVQDIVGLHGQMARKRNDCWTDRVVDVGT